VMLPTDTLFSADYATARAKFLAACALRGLTPQMHLHPLAGAQGEVLAADVVRVGPADARRVLVLTSGIHGVELFAGSGCQIDWLLAHDAGALPADTAVVVVHAINPWGASWLRRYTEDNVDFCRNFVDHAEPPASGKYTPLHAAIAVDPDDADAVKAADEVLASFAAAHGDEALYNALMAGQYAHPLGMGFGGQAPTWSRRTIEDVLRRHCASAADVCLVDYHTGLGPYGYGSLVALQRGEDLARMRSAFGEWVVAVHESDAPEDFAPVSGHSTPGYERALPGVRVTAAVLEYGTGRPRRMLELLVRDQREWACGTGRTRLSETRQALLAFFYPGEPTWQRSLADQSRQVVAQALRFLARAG
jgi:predicted deacylase